MFAPAYSANYQNRRRVARLIRRRQTIRIEASAPLHFCTRHIAPADFLRVREYASLNGFVFAGLGHGATLR